MRIEHYDAIVGVVSGFAGAYGWKCYIRANEKEYKMFLFWVFDFKKFIPGRRFGYGFAETDDRTDGTTESHF